MSCLQFWGPRKCAHGPTSLLPEPRHRQCPSWAWCCGRDLRLESVYGGLQSRCARRGKAHTGRDFPEQSARSLLQLREFRPHGRSPADLGVVEKPVCSIRGGGARALILGQVRATPCLFICWDVIGPWKLPGRGCETAQKQARRAREGRRKLPAPLRQANNEPFCLGVRSLEAKSADPAAKPFETACNRLQPFATVCNPLPGPFLDPSLKPS